MLGSLRDCVPGMQCVHHLHTADDLVNSFDAEIYNQVKEVRVGFFICMDF